MRFCRKTSQLALCFIALVCSGQAQDAKAPKQPVRSVKLAMRIGEVRAYFPSSRSPPRLKMASGLSAERFTARKRCRRPITYAPGDTG